jgi:hypothetical protein
MNIAENISDMPCFSDAQARMLLVRSHQNSRTTGGRV